MDETDILATVTAIMREYFDEDDLLLTRATTAADVPAWDSLSHVNIIVAVEQRFGIRFAIAEVEKLQDVGELVDAIAAKSSAKAAR